MDLNIIIPYRPVTHVTVQEGIAAIGLALFVLHPLRASKGPIEHLSLSFIDPITTTTLELIQEYTPYLQSLELAAPPSRVSELAWAPTLAAFKHLKHLSYETLLAHDDRVSPIASEFQEKLVRTWSEASRTLKTIEFSAELARDDEDTDETLVKNVDIWALEATDRWVHTREERKEKGW